MTTPISIEKPPASEQQLPPMAFWYHKGDISELELGSADRLAAMELYHTAWTMVQRTAWAAAYAAGLRVISSFGLASYHFGDTQPSDTENWQGYYCAPDTDTAGRTEDLVRFNYGVYLAWRGDQGYRSQLRGKLSYLLGQLPDVHKEKIATDAVIGQLVMPDIENGQLPGTPWMPLDGQKLVHALPRLPKPEVQS
jgi:hypothetical protein